MSSTSITRKRAHVVAAIALAATGLVAWRVTRRTPHVAPAVTPPLGLSSSNVDSDRIVGSVARLPATAGWCTRLAQSNAQTFAASSLDAGCSGAKLECVSDDAGAAWGFAIRSTREGTENGGCTTTTIVDFVRASGDARISGGEAHMTLTQSRDNGFLFETTEARAELLGDYDGDGDQELLVTRKWWAHEGGAGTDANVWTFKHGEVIPYRPAAGFVIAYTTDADRDGKADLVTAGPYSDLRGWAPIGFAYPIGAPIFLEHALPDGTFSMTDSIAVAFTQAKCAEHDLVPSAAIACDRMRGKSAKEVLVGRSSGDCPECDKWMPQAAAIAPPFKL